MSEQPNWDDLIAAAVWKDDEAELGRYTLVKIFDGSEIWIFDWSVFPIPKLVAEIVMHGQP